MIAILNDRYLKESALYILKLSAQRLESWATLQGFRFRKFQRLGRSSEGVSVYGYFRQGYQPFGCL